MSIPLWAPVLLPVFFGLVIYALPARLRKPIALFAGTAQVAVCIGIFAASTQSLQTLALGGWNPPVGIMLYADRFASVMILLTSFLFLMLILFELGQKTADKVFLLLFLVLEGLLSAIFMLDDLFSIFVLIEVSTIVVALLIMFKRDSRAMYDGLIYLLVNIFAATFMLFGLAILYSRAGTFSLSLLRTMLSKAADPSPYHLPLAMILTFVCLKAALMPLFSWLPRAHGTPSSPSVVSAALSGLYVKCGVYLFVRCTGAFVGIDTSPFFLVAGIITAVVGFLFAISQSDIKLILSYHTVSQLGLIMVAVNMDNDAALWGGIFHILNHALFKSALFLCAGDIIEEYGTRDITKMRGVLRRMPLTSAAMMAAILGITGAPFFNGSISKYLIAYGTQNAIGDAALILINIGTIVSFIKLSTIFFGDTGIKAKAHINRAGVCLALGLLCFVLGIFGGPAITLLFGVHMPIGIVEYLIKSGIFVLSVGVGWLAYRYFVKGRGLWARIRTLDLSFNAIALSVLLFFCVLLGYMTIA